MAENQHSSQNRPSSVTPVCLHKRQAAPTLVAHTGSYLVSVPKRFGAHLVGLPPWTEDASTTARTILSIVADCTASAMGCSAASAFMLMDRPTHRPKTSHFLRQLRTNLAVLFELAREADDSDVWHLPALRRWIARTAVELHPQSSAGHGLKLRLAPRFTNRVAANAQPARTAAADRPCTPSMSSRRTTSSSPSTASAYDKHVGGAVRAVAVTLGASGPNLLEQGAINSVRHVEAVFPLQLVRIQLVQVSVK